MTLKDRIVGNELDLSMNQLVDVPVKELATTTKATHLDLSCNLIQTLPNNFASLTHLVNIDLSKNKITELPDNFGNLVNLYCLDLYGNQIFTLPLSFCRLKNLRWLDLKNNPLNPELKTIAGDCLDSKQCESCAKSVVSFMQCIESSIERDKQKRLKEEREKEALRHAQVEKELEEQRRKKKAEKEKRKAEMKAKRDREIMLQNMKERLIEKNNDKVTPEYEEEEEILEEKGNLHWSTLSVLFVIAPLLVAATVIGFGVLRGHTLHDVSIADLQVFASESVMELRDATSVWWNAFLIPYANSLKSSVLQGIHSTLVYITEVFSSLNLSSFK